MRVHVCLYRSLLRLFPVMLTLSAAGSAVALPELSAQSSGALRLWYDRPASQGGASGEDEIWQRFTLPIGNGDVGANIYGEISEERLTVNEKTLWTGGPSPSRPGYIGGNLPEKGRHGATLRRIRELFAQGRSGEASALCDSLVGGRDGYGAYQSWGTLRLTFSGLGAAEIRDYIRDLDLRTAIASVSFACGGIRFRREYFVSNPDNVLVIRLEASDGVLPDVGIAFDSAQGGVPESRENALVLAGSVADNGLRYDSEIRVTAEGEAAEVRAADGALSVSGADAVTLYLCAATDYASVFPHYRTGETPEMLRRRVTATVGAAAEKGYRAVRADHVADYASRFGRVTLDLGQGPSARPTDGLLEAYRDGTATEGERRLLEVLLFQYGRYLMLSSSRENSLLPANLQGVWNNVNSPAWSSDYHLNVNLQMNYWPVYSTDLAECALPLVAYVNALRRPGRVTAEIYAGIPGGPDGENGFMAHTQNTPFGWTCPGWSFDWGWSPTAVPWILQNCWEHYEYTGDLDFMRRHVYPMLREEAVMFSGLLTADADGCYVTSPAYSPEHGPRTHGNTYEQTLVWQLLTDAMAAGRLVGEDAAVLADWQRKRDGLKGPVEIGRDGQVLEWYTETDFNRDAQGKPLGQGFGHRHLSHLLGLYPGDLITRDTPEWFEAARVSMNLRTDRSTGWGMGHRIALWARLGDGDRAHRLIGTLFAVGIYPNLWDAHPPFQIDGNFGMTAGVAEMLLQSHAGYIHLLPALPAAWAAGCFDGLVARGNFRVSAAWVGGRLQEAVLLSRKGGQAEVFCERVGRLGVRDAAGRPVPFERTSAGGIVFMTRKGGRYVLTPLSEE